MKKTIALMLALLLCAAALAGCAQQTEPTPSAPAQESAAPSGQPSPSGANSIYFLNFKPEIADAYAALAAAYQAETGIKVKVETAASGTYEQTLRSEIAKSEAPTIFQINGPVGYRNWVDYCADLSGSELYAMLSDQSLAIRSGDGVYGIPYVVEGYGIIYNNAILEKYFALDGAVVSSMDEVNNFATFRSLVEDMQAKKNQLGIGGVFASTSLSAGNQWRWQTHLAN